jgi:hypothetical protein
VEQSDFPHVGRIAKLPRNNRACDGTNVLRQALVAGQLTLWRSDMKRTLMSLAAAGVIATGGLAASTQKADAAWWVAPAIIGGVLLGGVTLAAAANANNAAYGYYANTYYQPTGNVYVRPVANRYNAYNSYNAYGDCRIARERVPGGWRRVQICY